MRAGRSRVTRALTVLIASAGLVLAGCTGSDDSGGTTTPTIDPTPPPVCTEGAPDRPTGISRLTLDGVTAETFSTTLTVPFAGLDSGTLDRPSVVQARVITETSNAPVTFRAPTGRLVESLDAPWLDAPSQLTVYSVPGQNSCVASVYLLSTRAGELTLTVESADTLTTVVDVVTSPSAGRDIALEVDPGPIQAGADLDVGVTVTDAFGNRVVNSVVIINVPRDAPARYLNGSNQATVLTDERGRARVQLVTLPDRGSTLTVRARGAEPSCDPLVNQFGCAADEPFTGAPEPRSPVRAKVTLKQPEVVIESPTPGLRLSAGQTFDVRAQTAGVESGTLTQVKLGDEVLSLGSVEDEGTLSMAAITALPTTETSAYGLIVGNLPRIPLDVTVAPFGVDQATVRGEVLTLRIDVGAWPAGTPVDLLRSGSVIERTQVQGDDRPWVVEVESIPGIYQVRARVDGGVVLAPEALAWP